MINKFRIPNGAKYFSLETFQNYLVFISAKQYIKYISVALLILICGNLMEYQKNNIENITKLDRNLALTFADHQLLPDINFN